MTGMFLTGCRENTTGIMLSSTLTPLPVKSKIGDPHPNSPSEKLSEKIVDRKLSIGILTP